MGGRRNGRERGREGEGTGGRGDGGERGRGGEGTGGREGTEGRGDEGERWQGEIHSQCLYIVSTTGLYVHVVSVVSSGLN